MTYSFSMDGARREHDLEAVVEVEDGDPGDRWTPPSGPEASVCCFKVMDGDRSYYRNRIFMVRNGKRRLLPAEMADKVGDLLIDSEHDRIVERASELAEDMRETAYELRQDR